MSARPFFLQGSSISHSAPSSLEAPPNPRESQCHAHLSHFWTPEHTFLRQIRRPFAHPVVDPL